MSIDCLGEDVGMQSGELHMAMRDIDVWKQTVGSTEFDPNGRRERASDFKQSGKITIDT